MKKTMAIIFGIVFCAASLSSCQFFSELMGLTTTTTTSTTSTTSTTLPPADNRTNYKPKLMFSTNADAKHAKVVTNDTMTGAAYNVALGCPALSGFIDGGAALDEGSNFQMAFLGTTVTFAVHYFEDGTADRLTSGVRYHGLSSDGSVDILVEFNPTTKAFFFEEGIFLQDPTGQVFNTANAKSAIYYTMKGTISADGSILAKPIGCAINSFGSYIMMAGFKRMEIYSGAWDDAATKKGTGIVLQDATYPSYNTLPAAIGGYNRPTTAFALADMPQVLGYMKSMLAATAPTYSNTFQLLYIVEGEPAFASVKDYLNGFRWPDGLAAPSTKADAKARLPSSVWKAKTLF
ncbi:hypothetical protein LWX53_05420 [bacterium]|nr:hypothetical protein [bacterium]